MDVCGTGPCRTLIHEYVFMPALRTQATDEQLAKYLPLAENLGLLGAYAQTELGHVRTPTGRGVHSWCGIFMSTTA